MAAHTRYSIYTNVMDTPFRFQGSFKSKKDAATAADKLTETRQHVLIVPEDKPDLEIGQAATGWAEFPKNYKRPVRA
jgi:hypothetical protein